MTVSEEKPPSAGRTMHLGVLFPNDSSTVWSRAPMGSQIAFDSFLHMARTAERAAFDFFFLTESLRLPEVHGRVRELDVAGRPESLTLLSALAAVTSRVGLAATVNTTFNEPFDLARRFSSLDHLSGGRAAWNVVTTSDAFTGGNFRRGGFLPSAERYTRARDAVGLCRTLWRSWEPTVWPGASPEGFSYAGSHFRASGAFTLPRSPQVDPVLIQAGNSDEGREFAASHADVVFTLQNGLESGRRFYADVKRRLALYGRRPDDLKVMPGMSFVLGTTGAEAHERAVQQRRDLITPQAALAFLEHTWGVDLSGYDPDGPLPEIGPADPRDVPVVQRWRDRADEEGLSVRELVVEVTGRQSLVGTPLTVARRLIQLFRAEAADGFIIRPHAAPDGLDGFVDEVVPLLQEMGAFRSAYTGSTLRDHLGLCPPG
ncbi:NtaA/DmoA family FMN-dependent monooxygenase [Streptomyces sp. NPDC058701]|uniref:NtaA/DmoA family FMN-dependent monooxygenase n=1 Tax=Streptomyces sp. NPDC058701 TaxID=3346608 RepID=UPI00365089CB